MTRSSILIVILALYFFPVSAQLTIRYPGGNEPLYFVDSVNVHAAEFKLISPSAISMMTIYKGAQAAKLAGPAYSEQGLIFIETRDFARRRFEKFFASRSKKYKTLLSKTKAPDSIVYILNNRVQRGRYESNLTAVDEVVFKELEIIKPYELKSKYQVESKVPGVHIHSDIPVKEL